jgi:predicted  nucleic acid-binding Zn-ribbon protein
LGILKIKQKIDSFKNWIKHVDQFLKRLQEANTSLNNKIYSLRNESELQQKIVDQNSFEIERIKKYLGLDQEDQVQSAAAEVLNGDS